VTTIHPTAIVDSKARIGENVTIGPFTIVEPDVIIGDNTQIGPHVFVANGARISKNCSIFTGAVVGTAPQDLKYAGEPTLLEIGESTVIREYCTLNRGTAAHGKTEIGSHCLLMAYSHVAHDNYVGNNVILANAVNLGGHVIVEDWAIIGGLCGVHQFCHIGAHCMIGAHLKVSKDIPPYILSSEEPMQFFGLNSIGLRRRGFSKETIMTLKMTYRLLYRSKLNVSQALLRIKSEIEPIPEVLHVIDFIEKADRGII
jgi:UDP-N-acetylglucosamine acyltransferase